MNFTGEEAAKIAADTKNMFVLEYAKRWQPVLDAVVLPMKRDIAHKCADPEYRWSSASFATDEISILVELPLYKAHKFGFFSKRKRTLLKALDRGAEYKVLQVLLERRTRSEGNQIWIILDRWALKLLKRQFEADGFKFTDYWEQFKIEW